VSADPAPAVRLTGLTTVLDDTPVLHRCSLDVEPGSMTVLMGPSGAGKSTVVRHLAGLLAPDRGTVEIGGTDVYGVAPDRLRSLRRRMSVMLGGPSLFDSSLFASLSAYDNVVYGLSEHGVHASRQADAAMFRLHEMGLDDRAEDRPSTLPAHARKRLALARALVVEAPLLVLDEVEAGLDAAHRDRVLAAVRHQHARLGCTTIVTTHDVRLARELGGTLAVLANGRIVARGDAAELLRGVEDGTDFDRRFRVDDFLGPPRLSDLGEEEPRTVSIDERMLFTGLAALILIAVLAALLTLGPPLPF
jgi:ABC-type transporter Mla maintaining outer membrane lipid asymmetry ATPase subunit MlaF